MNRPAPLKQIATIEPAEQPGRHFGDPAAGNHRKEIER
jgi:hypothetical protein